MQRLSLCAALALVVIAAAPVRLAAVEPPTGLVAEGHDSRIDLVWDRVSKTDEDLWHVYRAESPAGPWQRLTETPHTIHVYSDFVGENGKRYSYRVTRVVDDALDYKQYLESRHGEHIVEVNGEESQPSAVASATTVAMDDEQLLDSVQKGCFRYFWDFGHPVSGLAREGFTHPRQNVTTGGTGFGMITIMVGVERGFVSRAAAAERLLTMVAFLEDVTPRFHGLWSHHVDGATGAVIPFAGAGDDGADVVESAFLMEGMLTIREYFDGDDPVETELRERIDRLWREAEWDWMQQPGDQKLTWHWSPTVGFARNHKFDGFNECMIAYLLAMASPTHAIAPESYYLGWAGRDDYANGEEYYGIVQPIGRPLGGPLFFTHYSYLGLDPRQLNDAYANYFEANRALSLINRAYCIDNPRQHAGYSELAWGLTASQDPWGYAAHQPDAPVDNGTLTPTAALSAMPYAPTESLATLKYFYRDLGSQLWGPLGFYDAYHPCKHWVSPSFLAIDQGTIVPMIENHRTGLPWSMFMKGQAARDILAKLAEAGAARGAGR